MATPDRRAARTAAVGVLLVAVTAAVISFSHVRSVAIRAGETQLTSWLLPISIDGAVVASVSVLLADSRAGRRPAALTWLLLGLGISASLGANIASAEPTATARAVAAWPPLALALGIEVLAGLTRRNGRPRPEEAIVRPVAAQPATSGLTGSGSGEPAHALDAGGIFGMVPPSHAGSSTGRDADRPAALDDDRAVELIRRLDLAAPAGRVSRLEIQKALGCGGSRAARLAELARSAGDTRAG